MILNERWQAVSAQSVIAKHQSRKVHTLLPGRNLRPKPTLVFTNAGTGGRWQATPAESVIAISPNGKVHTLLPVRGVGCGGGRRRRGTR